jgi:Zn-dependent protease
MFITTLFSDPRKFIFFTVAIIIGITVHEFSHAWMATRLGDPTAKLSGRLTLNPIAHLDLWGTITLYIIGLGWGRPVPYNPNFVRRGVWGEALVALAGPVSNVLTAAIFALPDRLSAIIYGIHPTGPLFQFFSMVVLINVVLAIFNLFPIPPLDGSKILRLVVEKLSFRRVDWSVFERVGPVLLLAVILAEWLFNINIIWRIMEPIVAVVGIIVGSKL